MSRQYNNFVKKLKKYNVIMLTTEDEYLTDKEIYKYPCFKMRCEQNHEFSLKWTSLHNKLKLISEHPDKNICAQCDSTVISGEELRVREKCDEFEFEFQEYDKLSRRVVYKCSCGAVNSTHATNITRARRTAFCGKCQNEKFRITTDVVREKLEEYGCELLSEYLNTRTPISYRCVCEKVVSVKYCAFTQGIRCEDCGHGVTCEHNLYLALCNECASNIICKHNKYTKQCKECPTISCNHGQNPKRCIYCYPQNACKICLSAFVFKSSSTYPNCYKCYVLSHPETIVTKTYYFKEHYLRDAIKENYLNLDIVFNKTLHACSNRRPDIFIERYTHIIIIECDEYQHRYYECENKRMMELFEDAGSRPLVMIRFNPDSYIDKDEMKVISCFTRSKDKGMLELFEPEWNRRIQLLTDTIDKYLENLPEQEITLVKLFYNEIIE